MINKQLKGLTATNLRLILIASIVLLLLLSGAAFVFFRQFLIQYSNDVSNDNAAASASSEEISKLQKLKGQLETDKVAVTRAQKIVADSTSYQYQNQILDDISLYAKSAGITINGFAFNSNASDTQSSGAASGQASTAPKSNAPANLKSTEATISVKSPVSYKSIMNFLYAIEQNLTKMQVTSVSLSKDPSSNGITVNPITIKVYTR